MVEQPKLKEPEFMKPLENQPPNPAPKTEAPPGPPALDAAGQGAGDAFGLEGRPGGGDFLGGGGGGGGSRFGWYVTMLQQHAQDALRRQPKLLGARYQVSVELWLNGEGAPERVELLTSSGKPDVDRLLKENLRAMAKLSEPPPAGMQQPIVMRVTSS